MKTKVTDLDAVEIERRRTPENTCNQLRRPCHWSGGRRREAGASFLILAFRGRLWLHSAIVMRAADYYSFRREQVDEAGTMGSVCDRGPAVDRVGRQGVSSHASTQSGN